MAAPDYLTVSNVKPAIEAAWKQVLINAGIARVSIAFESVDLKTPRAEVELRSANATGHRAIIRTSPVQFNMDAWDGQLITRIVTSRERNAAMHNGMLSKAILEAMYFRDRFTTAVLPYHAVTMIQHQSISSMSDPARNIDVTELTHRIVFNVRANAWPDL